MLPPSTARSIDAVSRLPWFGKIGLSTVLCTKLGVTLLIVRLPPCPSSSESKTNGLRRSTSSCVGVSCDRSPTDEMVEQPVARSRHDWSISASFRSVILTVSYE